MKIINLSGFWKSEFEPKKNYSEVFTRHGFGPGRLISGSKSGYRQIFPNNLVVFNANILTKKGGKVWYGDLDVTLDFYSLKDVADELGEDLYILYESDARFGNENEPIKKLIKKAVTIIKAESTSRAT